MERQIRQGVDAMGGRHVFGGVSGATQVGVRDLRSFHDGPPGSILPKPAVEYLERDKLQM